MKLKQIILGVAATMFLAVSPAQQPPGSAVTILTPAAAGGLSANVAIAVQPTLSKILDQPVVVDFKPGGSGAVAMNHVVDSKNTSFYVGPVNPLTGVNQRTDMVPVVNFGTSGTLIVGRTDLGVKTLKELINKNTGKTISMAYPNGSAQENYVKGLATHVKTVTITPVPYKGGGDALTAVLGGHVDTAVVSAAASTPAVKEKGLIPLANLAPTRTVLMPDAVTVHEQGVTFENYEMGFTTFMLWASPSTPEKTVAQVRKDMLAWLQTADGQAFLQKYDFPTTNSAQGTPDSVLKKLFKWSLNFR